MAKRHKTKKTRPGRLRIVAGKWRSRLLDIADVPGLRPTAERIRETLFNWLATPVHGARCLDLYAGTGALGLEALSRGAGSVVFVEQSARAVTTLEANIRTLGAGNAEVLRTDARQFLEQVPTERFDLVFLDPPFAADLIAESCGLLDGSGMLADECLIYIEQDRQRKDVDLPEGWQILKDKTAGNVRYMLVQRKT